MEIIRKSAYIFAILGILFVFLLAQYYPQSLLSYKCIFHEITGLYCAGCGGTRALLSLLHGEILMAFHLNALLMILLPVALYCYITGFFNTFFKKKLPFPKNHIPYLWVLLSATFIFMIVRNIDISPFAFLKPT